MPIIASRGAASSRGFGEFSVKKQAGYKYLLQTGSNTIYATNIEPRTAVSGQYIGLPRQPESRTFVSSGNGPYIPTILHNSTGAMTNWQTCVFNNNWQPISYGSYSAQAPILGTNGSIAYNPTTKVAVTAYTQQQKGNFRTPILSRTNLQTGSHTTTSPFLYLGNTSHPISVVYSPALDGFYFNINGNILAFNGTTGAYIGMVGGNSSNMPLSISDDGYLLDDQWTGSGSTFRVMKFTTQDLNTSSQIATYSRIGYNYGTRIYVGSPGSGTYYRLGYPGGFGGFVYLFSWNPGQSQTQVAAISFSPLNIIYRVQLLFDNNIFYVVANGNIPGKYSRQGSYMQSASINDLNTWTYVGNFFGDIHSMSIQQ